MGFEERNEKHEQAKLFLVKTQPLPMVRFDDVGREKYPVFHQFLISLGEDNREAQFLCHFPDLLATRLDTKKCIYLDLKAYFRSDFGNTCSECDSIKAMNQIKSLGLNTGYLLYKDNFEFYFVKELVFNPEIKNHGSGSNRPYQLASQIKQKVGTLTALYDCLS